MLAVGVRQPRGRQGATRWRTRVACSVYARVQLRGPWAMGYMGVKAYASLFFTPLGLFYRGYRLGLDILDVRTPRST